MSNSKFKCVLLVVVTLTVMTASIGCGTKKNGYHKCSPYVLIDKDTTEVYIRESKISSGLKTIWTNDSKNPYMKVREVRVIDSITFERMVTPVGTNLTGIQKNN